MSHVPVPARARYLCKNSLARQHGGLHRSHNLSGLGADHRKAEMRSSDVALIVPLDAGLVQADPIGIRNATRRDKDVTAFGGPSESWEPSFDLE